MINNPDGPIDDPEFYNRMVKNILSELYDAEEPFPEHNTEKAVTTDRVNKLRELAYQAVEAEFPEWPDTKIAELAETLVENYRVKHAKEMFQSGAALLRSTTPPFPFFEAY